MDPENNLHTYIEWVTPFWIICFIFYEQHCTKRFRAWAYFEQAVLQKPDRASRMLV